MTPAGYAALCGIPACGVCAFSDALLLPNVRSARRLPDEPKSVVICAFPYYTGIPQKRNLSLYAMLPDYHTVVLQMLGELTERLRQEYPQAAFAAFADASPLREVECASRAGLGLAGKNGLMIVPPYGSFVFLGEIVTDLALPVSENASAPCIGCGACLRTCPGGALQENGVDLSRCRSHITQKKGQLSDEEIAAVRQGGLVWGCDRCLLACPYNRDPQPTPIEAFRDDVKPVLTEGNLPRLLQNRAFAWRGEAVLRRNLAILSPKTEIR